MDDHDLVTLSIETNGDIWWLSYQVLPLSSATKPLLSIRRCPIHQGPGQIEDIQVPRDGRVVAAEAQRMGLGASVSQRSVAQVGPRGSLVDAAVLLLALVDRGEDHPLLTILLSALELGWFRYHLLWPIPWVFFRWFWPWFWLEWIMLRKTYSLNNVCSPQKM